MKIIKFKMMMMLVILNVSPTLSFSQYFQKLYDVDSAYDWGWNIFLQSDSNYFVTGVFQNQTSDKWAFFNMQISIDGNNVFSKHILQFDSTANLYPGNLGETKQLIMGGYIVPATLEWPNHITHYLYSAAGILKYNAAGDTVFLKTYTDTSIYFDAMYCCAVMTDEGYILGGGHGLNVASNHPGYLIRTDSMGDTSWTRTYQYDPSQPAIINNVIPLADGRIVVGAMSTYIADAGPPYHDTYYYNIPWFLVLDSLGNMLKDTIYSNGYMVGNNTCGELYNDMNGGYINIGTFDSLFTTDPSDAQNFPAYIAHLDTNFRITWITEFPYSDEIGHRQGVVVHQLMDSSYVVVGDAYSNTLYSEGFVAKISRTGALVWSHNYMSDSADDAYIRGVAQKPDGSLVFTGESFDDTLPTWRAHQDVWLIGTDSNGCNIPGCLTDTTTAVKPLSLPKDAFSIFPNPATSTLYFTFPLSANTTIKLTDITGRIINGQVLHNATGASFNVKGYLQGIYLFQVTTDTQTQSGKIVIE